jgi:hypothetical protein
MEAQGELPDAALHMRPGGQKQRGGNRLGRHRESISLVSSKSIAP